MRTVRWVPILFLAACSTPSEKKTTPGPTPPQQAQDPDDGGGEPITAGLLDAGTPVDSATAVCEIPEVLIVLDRSASMHKTPGGTEPPNTVDGRNKTKWALAIGAVKTITAAPIDATVRFGLELFPRDPGGDKCKTVSQILNHVPLTNPSCQQGEIVIAPDLNTGDDISSSLTVNGTPLCFSTPISAAVDTAITQLASTASAGRPQHIVLISDGGESCNTDPAEAIGRAAAAGIKTHVVGFACLESDNITRLNAMACAGQTAIDFATNCKLDGTNYVPVDPTSTTPLYRDAADGATLQTELMSVAGGLCCGCMDG